MRERVDLVVVGGGINGAGVAEDPRLGEEVARGVPLVELEHVWSTEDARTVQDFLVSRTKLNLALDDNEQARIGRWFTERAHPIRNQGADPHEQRQHSATD